MLEYITGGMFKIVLLFFLIYNQNSITYDLQPDP